MCAKVLYGGFEVLAAHYPPSASVTRCGGEGFAVSLLGDKLVKVNKSEAVVKV